MRGTPVEIADFSGGIRRDLGVQGIPLGSCYDACNVEPSGQHGLHRREAAVSLVGPLASRQRHLFFSNLYNASYTVGDSDGIMRKDGVNIASGLTTGGYWDWAEAPASAGGAARLYAADGVNAFKVINNTVVANVVASAGALPPVTARHCVWHGGRFFMASGYRLYASGAGDPTDWSTAVGHGYQVDFDVGSPFVISGLAKCGPYLLVFKQNAVYVVYDLDTGANRPISDTVGAAVHGVNVAWRPYCSANGKVYFVNRGGVYVTSGESITKVSLGLGDYWGAEYIASRVGRLAYLDGFLMIYPQGGTTASSVLVYDEEFRSWWRHGFNVDDVSWSNAQSSPEEAFVMLNSPDGVAYYIVEWRPHHYDFTPTLKQDPGKTGLAISQGATLWKSGAMVEGQPAHRKRLRSLEIQAKATDPGSWTTDLALAVWADGLPFDGGGATTSRTLSLAGNTRRVRVPTLGVGRTHVVQLAGDPLFNIDNMTLAYQYRKD